MYEHFTAHARTLRFVEQVCAGVRVRVNAHAFATRQVTVFLFGLFQHTMFSIGQIPTNYFVSKVIKFLQ